MPDAIRITVEGSGAHPPKARLRASSTRYSGFRAAGTAIAAALGLGHPLALTPAGAEDTWSATPPRSTLYIAAILQLDRHETRRARAHARHSVLRGRHRHPAGAHAPAPRRHRGRGARREHRGAGRRSTAPMRCCCSEPQILIAWAAAADDPEIIGDPSLVTGPDAPHRVLAFGTWLEPDKAPRHGALGRRAARPRRSASR